MLDERFIDMLRCPRCRGRIAKTARPAASPFALKTPLGDYMLKCNQCRTAYPVTDDDIPILWTEELRQFLLDGEVESSSIAANAAVYDQVSDSYDQYWRKESILPARMRYVVGGCLASLDSDHKPVHHLDFGCGPGHVINWLDQFDLYSVGLDVSLSNLRNTRKNSGAQVVLASADAMPFEDGAFELVTESSVLHHIKQWDKAIHEAARVCAADGVIFLDCEPSRQSKDWSKLASFVFELRWYPYVFLSRFRKDKFWYRDVKTARIMFESVEIHNLANTGLEVDRAVDILQEHGFKTLAVRSPDRRMRPGEPLPWQERVLHLLSLHNPFDSRYGWFSTLATRGAVTFAPENSD